ncbi:malonyl CoA-acyl carrier protein transacylase [Elusimicrobium posterum]|uniref:SDR family NAD(P)-dependent oxidoreductase n=1 Tax=Elusimicrobium posterum TaxID=3116653 RepID=UPI003C74D0A2
MANKNLEPIAIIGIGAVMPEALNKDIFWQNILSGKNCITEVPTDTHWDPALFYDPDHSAPDKTYSKIGGFIRGFQFNSLKYRIPPQVAKQMDTVQGLAVECSAMALADAGYDTKEFDRTRTAVIIGNAMGGMKQELSNTRTNAPLFKEIIKKTKTFGSLSPAQAEALIDEVQQGVNDSFLPITEDTMPGELSNVIAGRVANVLNVNGTNFTCDAACATSLAAIDQAVNGLRMGNYDMVLCGGVDQMMSPSAFIKFSKIGALSAEGSFPFDSRANGFVMAEGAGIVVLKRLSDAMRDGDNIYAVVRAVGASSDGKGKGITAPNPKGQKLAVEKAFEQLDYTPGDVGMIEAHGTGTKVGDATEVTALNEVYSKHAKPGSIGLGSVKSQIGHAKAAAGIASLIKMAMALKHKVMPPTINIVTPNPIVDWTTSPFKLITQPQEWGGEKIRRANVSSFGFGGTNFHVALEEFHPGLKTKTVETNLNNNTNTTTCACSQNGAAKENVMDSQYNLMVPGEKLEGDMLSFSGDSKQELFNNLNLAVKESEKDAHFISRNAFKNHTAPHKQFAVVINVENLAKFKEKVEFFLKIAATMDVWTQDSLHLKMKGIYPFRPSKNSPKVCFMFPGQGSQYVDMMKDLASKYKVVKDTFDEADRILKDLINTTLTEVIWSKEGETKEDYAKREEAIKQTQMTQPAVMTADVAMMRLLSSYGIKPEVVMGHSLGEYAAAVAAGIFDFENGLKSVTNRAKSMQNIKVEDPGMMISVSAPVERVAPELKKINGYIDIANKNCPTQTVIAGDTKAGTEALQMFTDMGIQSVRVPVSHAFHSKIIEPAEAPYREFLNTLTVSAPKLPITSNVTADFFPNDPEKIKDLLVQQLVSSVQWIDQLRRTYDSGVRLFVECGPKRVLSAFATNTLDDKKDIKVMASNHPKKGGISEFNDLLANLTASGIALDWSGTSLDNGDVLNPAFKRYVKGEAAPAQTQQLCQAAANTPKITEASPMNISSSSIVISGIAAGTPGTWDKVFREGALDEILQGRNLIEPISPQMQQKQIDKNVEHVHKSPDGNHRVEKLTSIAQSVKLSARAGMFDLQKEFGLPGKWVDSMDKSFQLAIAAGMLALKDAGIPLVQYYKPTSTGGYLPDRWGLPASMIDDTGIIFTSAFPNANAFITEVVNVLTSTLSKKSKEEIYKFYEAFIGKIADPALRMELTQWFAKNFASYDSNEAVFTQNFLLKTIPIAHSHFAQWIRARGPATALSGACASTAQAVGVASDWIKLGRAKRVIIISGDDITNDQVSEWVITGFLASGAASTEADVTKAAVPFDLRRNGMIVGMGAAALVVEAETEINARGMKPLAKVLETDIRNSGFHPTRLDVNHVAQVMDEMVSKAERDYGINRSEMAKQLVFISHETYTPARGGSASAEVNALKRTFGADVGSIIVSNTKGFTGHAMGAGIEDVIAVRCLNTGVIPPIANYKEPDPELAGINLSKGGKYNFKYSLRLGAGFGSQVGMTLMEKMWSEGEPRIFDQAANQNWLKQISGQANPVLEVAQNTLRVKDNYVHGQKPAVIMEGSQGVVATAKSFAASQAPVKTMAAAQPAAVKPAAAPAPVAQAPVTAAPATSGKALDKAAVTTEIVNLISEKTGYPQDMLELDLDMEADLGIDTVKQAELFAAIREKYNIAQQEGASIQLKDYPTITHVIGYVLDNAGASSAVATPAPAQAAAPAPVAQPAPAVKPAVVAAPATASASLNKEAVTTEIVNLISEKTGYPQDMLELDLDMEADLGIDTVKQAELFAAIREKYNIAQQEGAGIQLKDYPTINHVIGYVMDSVGGANANSAPDTGSAGPLPDLIQPEPEETSAEPAAPAPAVAVAPVHTTGSLDEGKVTIEIVNLISEKTGYPQDMLELDLDMEADLGIDTVKQAELFAAIREKYSIAQQEGTSIQLKDYPSIRHVIGYVMGSAGVSTDSAAVQPQAATVPVQSTPVSFDAPPASLDDGEVTTEIVNLISEKTGYPQDMLELDLDMEADLGIDTVKQAELFAAIREKYGIGQTDGTSIQLKDYPSIRHVIGFVMDSAAGANSAPDTGSAGPLPDMVKPEPAETSAEPAAPAPAVAVAPAPAPKAAASGSLNEGEVTTEIVNLISEKTGYPQDMLELDLDMEADLGIDTVKQAELFAAIREKYSIAQQQDGGGIQLKDYPTIRHVVGFVMDSQNASAPAAVEAAPAAPQAQPQTAAIPAQQAAPAHKAQEPKEYQGEDCHNRKLRYVPTLVDAPLTEKSARRLSKDRAVLIFADSAPLIKAYTEWFKKQGIKTHVFTTLKARSKNTTIVNWDSVEETDAVLREYQKENPGMQGIVYLLGCSIKKFDKKSNPHAELIKHVMPLFTACKVFEKDFANKADADTFFAVNIKLDASFGYATKEAFNPTIGSLGGAIQCFRKDMYEVTGAFSKFLDFELEDTPEFMAEKTMEEILQGDMRFMVSFKDNRRSTILSLPTKLNRKEKNFDLAGKTIAFTGSGRGIGALLSQKIAAQYHSKIIVLDIIEITEKTPVWASMNETELGALKNQIWADLKARTDVKATPVMLDREFGKVKDSITLYNNLEKLRTLGSEVEYYHCDVMNGTMMKDVITKIKAKGGRVDGLIHFAGLERSKLVTDKTYEEFFRIFDVKATSGAALLALNLVKDNGFFAFATSIAGKYGNLGQSDYGSANEYLAKLSWALMNQGIRAVNVSMSAFSNVGMGIRPGVETFLKSNGVEFVDPQDGMQIFLDEIVYGKIPEIVLTNTLGTLDWDRQVKTDWDEIVEEGDDSSSSNSGNSSAPASSSKEEEPETADLKENHFLGNIQSVAEGKSLTAEKEYTVEGDHYLVDHAIEGTPYVPGVMGLETFMEAATTMLGKKPKGMENVHYFLPIKLLRNRPQTVRIKGEVDGNGAADFEIESDFINSKGVKMGDTRRHFTARALTNVQSRWASVKDSIKLTDKIKVTKEEIYKRYFHGPSFQVLGGVLDIAENSVLALYKRPDEKLFTDGPKKLIGYPLLVEAAFQACGYRDLALENRMNLPDAIGKYIVHGKGKSPEQLYIYGQYKGLSIEGKSIYDAFVFDEDMNLWIELTDYYGIGQ